jgi:hypothetical protein
MTKATPPIAEMSQMEEKKEKRKKKKMKIFALGHNCNAHFGPLSVTTDLPKLKTIEADQLAENS